MIPLANREDLTDIPTEVTEGMEIVPVRTMDEVLREAIAVQ